MTQEEQIVILKLYRLIAKFGAELSTISSLLDQYEQDNRPPIAWRSLMDELRKQPEYLESLRQAESAIANIPASTDGKNLIEVLLKVSDEQLPN